MKRTRTLLSTLACLLAFVFAFAFVGCDNTDKKTAVKSVTLSETSVTLGPGDTKRLTATVTLADDTKGEVEEWTTSSEAVATVTKGVIAAKGAGTATITAKAGDQTATCSVTVEDITVELNKTTLSLEKGSEETLTATVKKNGTATAESVDWTSSDELVATVDANGKITAKSEGKITITATRHGASQKAECELTVTWTKPAGYEAVSYYEQNKVPTNKWGYWNDPANYVGGKSEMHEAYYQDSAESEAGKVNFTFTVTERDATQDENKQASIIQITYRSSSEQDGGKLNVNHNYKLDFELTSSVAGKIGINPIGKEPTPEATAIKAGANALSVEFRHGDWGVIFPEGTYDNVESAAFILLGLLGEPGETVTVSIDKLHWTDLGESGSKTEKPDFSPPKVPDLSNVNPVALEIASADTEKYQITKTEEGKSYNVKYNTKTSTYETVAVSLEDIATDQSNTFAITVKNNGTTDIALRFDLKGTVPTAVEGGEQNLLECVTKAAVEGGTAYFNAEWGGTELTVKAGETATLYLTYACEPHGKPVELTIFFNTQYYNDIQEDRSGDVTLSGFKFATVTEE